MKPAAATKVDSTPHLMVDKQGFSQRNDKLGTGSTVSYGLLLKNTSTTQDATETYLLINFATASGELIGTVTKKVELVPANGMFAFGDSLHLRTQTPVSNLEVTIKVLVTRAGQAPDPAPLRQRPRSCRARRTPAGSARSTVRSSTTPRRRRSPSRSSRSCCSTPTGRIVGGGTTTTFSPLPSGSRMVFLARSGFTAVPASSPTTLIISVDPTYPAD